MIAAGLTREKSVAVKASDPCRISIGVYRKCGEAIIVDRIRYFINIKKQTSRGGMKSLSGRLKAGGRP